MYIDVSHKYNTQTCTMVMNSFKCFIEKKPNTKKSVKHLINHDMVFLFQHVVKKL